MLAKIGKGILLVVGILMILSVTVFDPADITEEAKRLFGLTTGQRADRDIEGITPAGGREAVEQEENAAIRERVETLKIADTQETIERLSTLPQSRVVGYPGNEMAADYVEDAFRSIGLHGVTSQPFEVAVPVDEGGSIEVAGLDRKMELSCLWPNEVQTPSLPSDFEGSLVDGKSAAFRDFNGLRFTRTREIARKVGGKELKAVEEAPDAIVLLNFDCGQDWMNAGMLGAKAVVFFDNSAAGGPEAVTRGEAELKFLGVAANLPRFWVSRADGLYLRDEIRRAREEGRELRARLRAKMAWKRVKTRNIVGFIPGMLPPEAPSEKYDYKRQRIIVVSAFYDSMSVVPRVAPGAENACGLSALLQAARVLKEFPSHHTVVFLATSSHFHCLWGVQNFLKECLPTDSELWRKALPKGRVDFDLFVGLDLTSHNNQVATTCFGTFYNRWWEMEVYRKNLLAPYAKKLTEYAARIFRKSPAEATCPHINAITPPKKTWKNFVPRPVAFDAEGVEARGKNSVTIFTPNELRNLVDTPNDTLDRLDLEKLHTQVKTVAALLAKAGRDVQFFTDSKLHLKNRINYTRGNATWFDRALNPNIPKAPVGGAIVTFRHPAAGMTNAGVRTLYTAYAQDDNPHDGNYEQGYYIDPVTLNSRRVTINVWSRHYPGSRHKDIGELQDGEVQIQSGRWLATRKLKKAGTGKNATATILVAERFVLEAQGGKEGTVTLPTATGAPLKGWWGPAPPEIGKRSGRFIPREQDDPHNLPPDGHAHIQVGNARYRGPILVPPERFELVVDLDPPGWLERALTSRRIERVKLPPDEPDIPDETRVIRSLVLRGSKGTYEAPANVDVAFGRFEGQFLFPFLLTWGWGEKLLWAYKLDDDGRIIYAQDEGSQGRETYPNDVKYGGGAQCVLFQCRPMTILEIVDSRYLTVLDQVGVLGVDNSVPQQWGARYIAGQSRQEGGTTSAAVVFARYDTVRDEPTRLKVHMGTGLYGIKLLLTNAELERRDRGRIATPPQSPFDDLAVTLDEARGRGYLAAGQVLLYPTYRVAWDMWVLNEYRLRELQRYGISNTMLANFPTERRSPLLRPEEIQYAPLCARLSKESQAEGPSPGKRILELVSADARTLIAAVGAGTPLDEARRPVLRDALNGVINRRDFHQREAFGRLDPPDEARDLLARDRGELSQQQVQRLNRLLLEAAYPDEIGGMDRAGQLGLHDYARHALIEAHKALRKRDYERFMTESRRAWGFEAKAYPEVASQADDTVKGVVFYFILLIPFAFFMERLLIGAADIRRRIAGFAVIFLLVFAVLRFVHPAFKLSSSPYIILLAFVILAMGVIVLFIVVSKFNQEIRKMKQAATGIQQADVGRLSATYAAVMLGISNLRKRKVRTTLTAVTLTLLTFTVLSFTSISQTLYTFKLSRSNEPNYEGALVRDRNWRGLQTVVLDYLRSEFSAEATIAPRAWLVSKTRGEKEFYEFTAAGGSSNVNGIVGLTPQEVRVNPARIEGRVPTNELKEKLQKLAAGTRLAWSEDGGSYVCVLPGDVHLVPRTEITGLTPLETDMVAELLKGGGTLKAGPELQAIAADRWFPEGDPTVCILPEDQAKLFGLTPQELWGGGIEGPMPPEGVQPYRALARRFCWAEDEGRYVCILPGRDRYRFVARIHVAGLAPQEAAVVQQLLNDGGLLKGGPQLHMLPGSRWFAEGDRHAVILPDDVAARVGIKPEALQDKPDEKKPTILMLGHTFRVIGLVDSKALNAYKDIDDEKLTPVDTVQEGAKMKIEENPDEAAKAPIQAFTHLEASNVMFLPYELVIDVGGSLSSVALSTCKETEVQEGGKTIRKTAFTRPFKDFTSDVQRFMQRVALNMFVARGRGLEGKVEVWSSIQTSSFSGIGNILVPMIIAALIVLNTMMGAVYERFREIYIYSSVGLAPTHIAALFLAESAVFATVGAVAGYLIGQTVAGVVQHLDLLGTITLNYSSASAISSSVLVMLTVFASTLYPAWKASQMAVPDVTRRWEFPPPQGDRWQFDFPFTVGGAEILGMYCYLARFLQSYGETSIGAFYTEDVKLAKGPPGEGADYVISTRCWLAPYDLGISQDVRFGAVPTGEFNIYRIVVTIHRVSGDTLSWQRMNRGFLNVLRKQFLVWRTVPSGTKLEYAEEGKRAVGEAPPVAAPVAGEAGA
jgi:hypothetical protein